MCASTPIPGGPPKPEPRPARQRQRDHPGTAQLSRRRDSMEYHGSRQRVRGRGPSCIVKTSLTVRRPDSPPRSRTAEKDAAMRITPRYEGAAVMNVDAVVRSPSTALVRQRARLARSLRGLSTGEWNTPSRCGGWTVQDVVEHRAGVNRFWSLSIQAGLRGEPTRFLASFDPVRVPAAMVEAAREGDAVQLLEALSLRAPRLSIAGKHRWLLAGLDEAFGAGTYLDAAPPAPS